MTIVVTRKLIRMGAYGLVVTVPKGWADFDQLKACDSVSLIVAADVGIEPHAEREKDTRYGSR